MKHYIYALVDPRTKQIRYVGRTYAPDQRHSQHAHSREQTPKGVWIAELRAVGLKPQMAILEEVSDSRDVAYREQWWLSLAKRQGWVPTNSSSPSAKKASFGDMFSEHLRHQYEVFCEAVRAQEPIVMITRAQFKVFLMLLYVFVAVLVGAVIGLGAWHFDYSMKGSMFSAIWLGATMGIVSTFMLCRVAALGFKRSWLVYIYCGVYFLFGLHQFWG